MRVVACAAHARSLNHHVIDRRNGLLATGTLILAIGTGTPFRIGGMLRAPIGVYRPRGDMAPCFAGPVALRLRPLITPSEFLGTYIRV